MFPQFFLAGVFNPIDNLPTFLAIISRFSPMTYAVDLVRGTYVANVVDTKIPTMFSISTNMLIISAFFFVFLIVGTLFFVRNERNR
jgi:ABC-2 type transport system permease protein